MLEPGAVVEHGRSRSGRWLRENRVRLALGIAVVEGLLVVVDQIHWAPALVVAIAVVVLYFTLGDRIRFDAARQVAWIAAVSQAFVMLVPVLLIVVSTVALILVGILAVIALVLLFADRR